MWAPKPLWCPIGLIKDGDIIELDARDGIRTITLKVTDSELEKRRAEWKPRVHEYQSGALWKYAQTVGSAQGGAVTHPGAKAETHVFADL